MRKWFAPVLLASLPAVCAQAAEEQGSGNVALHGFGTLGAVHHNASGVEYRRDISQPQSGAKAGQVSFAQDSMLAVQADFFPRNELSGVVQVVSRLNAENSFVPEVTMANLKYGQGASHLHLGRMLIETYLEGDAAEIGYANYMVRQPVIYYPRSFDGAAADTTWPLNAGLLRLQAQAGWETGKLVSNGAPYDASGTEMEELGVDYSQSGWTARISAGQTISKHETPDLQAGGAFTAAMALIPNGAQLFEKFSMEHRKISNRMLTLAYDKDGLKTEAGYSTFRSSAWPVQKNGYLRGAYRMGDFTPYASYIKRWAQRSFTGTGIPDGVSAQIDAMNVAISNGEAALVFNQSELALGLRYDFMPERALKLQWEHIHLQDSQSLIDSRAQTMRAENREFRSMSLFSVAFEFIF